MLSKILSKAFPPKLGKVEGHHASLLLAAIGDNKIPIVVEDPPEAGVGPVREWSSGRWRMFCGEK